MKQKQIKDNYIVFAVKNPKLESAKFGFLTNIIAELTGGMVNGMFYKNVKGITLTPKATKKNKSKMNDIIKQFGKEYDSFELCDQINKLDRDRLEAFIVEALAKQKAEIEKVIEGAKTRHELDRELWDNTSGGCQCENCGKQAYEDGEECFPDDVNKKLNGILTKIKKL